MIIDRKIVFTTSPAQRQSSFIAGISPVFITKIILAFEFFVLSLLTPNSENAFLAGRVSSVPSLLSAWS